MASDLIKIIKNDPDRKGLLLIYAELIRLLCRYKNKVEVIDIYTRYLMYKKDAIDIRKYLPFRYLTDKRNELNYKHGKNPIINDKIKFVKTLQENSLPTTKLLGEIISKKIIYKGQITPVSDTKELYAILRQLLLQYDSIFIKRVETFGGKDVFKISKNNIHQKVNHINLDYNYIIEETIRQHPSLDAINPRCINTLRIITYRVKNDIHITTACLRMGMGKAQVDNISSGGIFINFDIKANRLAKTGYRTFKYGGKSYSSHPDSKFVFKDKTLPFTNEIVKTVKRAALLFNTPLIGWDFAFSDKGPLIIEANDNPGLISMQIMSSGVLNNKYYKRIFDR